MTLDSTTHASAIGTHAVLPQLLTTGSLNDFIHKNPGFSMAKKGKRKKAKPEVQAILKHFPQDTLGLCPVYTDLLLNQRPVGSNPTSRSETQEKPLSQEHG